MERMLAHYPEYDIFYFFLNTDFHVTIGNKASTFEDIQTIDEALNQNLLSFGQPPVVCFPQFSVLLKNLYALFTLPELVLGDFVGFVALN